MPPVKATGKAEWFTYFPDDYRWSASVCMLISAAQWGGSDIGEVDRVGRVLRKRIGDDELWFREWIKMGGQVRALGMAEERRGNRLSAAAHFKRACLYYQIGDRFRQPKDKKALSAFRTSVDCFHRYLRLTDRPRTEHVTIITHDGEKLPAYFVHAENTRKAKPPVVVLFDGLDTSKEIVSTRAADGLSRRGMSCLFVDGPGTGEAIRFHKSYLRHDYEAAGSAAIDYLETRKDVNTKKAGIMAVSLGGYYAPRCASMDRRFKACVAWGAIWDYHGTWKGRFDSQGKAAQGVPTDYIHWVLNTKSEREALDKLEGFKLDGVVQKMRCPFLLTHGEDDRQISLRDARALYRAVGSKDKTMKIFTRETGGAQHCQNDYLSVGLPYMQDWIGKKLGA
ncbi:MAG: prolyl oligopeptidase family serine peptidase [Nitrospinota bacterium]|nr:prolyl oligopeptidase family serine peptidase [Nitrospinota bacterium]